MQKPWPEINRTYGFTLIEVLIALSILCIGLLTIGFMNITTIRGNTFAENITEASTIACDRIEKLVQLGLEDFDNSQLQDTNGNGDAGLNAATTSTADFSATQGKYTIFWNISDNSLINNTKTINVIVTWTEKGVQRSVSIQHIIPEVI